MSETLAQQKVLDKSFLQPHDAVLINQLEFKMKFEFSEDDVKQVLLAKAAEMCPAVDWNTVEIEAGYGYLRRAVVTFVEATEASDAAQ